MKPITNEIARLIEQRQAEGERKYGKTIERDDMRPSACANHALEEMADGVQYAARCVETIERLEFAASMALAEFTAQIEKMADGAEKDRITGIARKLVVSLEGGDKKPFGLPWHEAPHWAMWAAMDSDKCWFWFHSEPFIGPANMAWIASPDYRHDRFNCNPHPDWTHSKQKRPE